MESFQVIIVGGGAAGLGAAKTLGSDVNYVLIEAQNYLGGRIWTVDAAPNLSVDLGAQYIHGDQNNSVYDICTELGVILPDGESTAGDEMIGLTLDGGNFEPSVIETVKNVWSEAKDAVSERLENAEDSPPVSFADVVPEEFRGRLSSSIPQNLIGEATEYMMKFEMAEVGCSSLNDLNMNAFAAFEDLKGRYEHDLKNGGYRPFINHLKSFIPDDGRVRLNSEVVRVKFDSENGQVLVEVNDLNRKSKTTLTAPHVIWTTSLGHLKANFQKIFDQETDLIEQKQSSIEKIGFGTVNKVLTIYNERFWPEGAGRFAVFDSQKKSFKPSDKLRKLLQKENVDSNCFNEIVRQIFHYDILPSTEIPVLICWFVGSTAILTEKLSEQLAGQITHEVICQALNVPSEQFQPNRVIKSAWSSNKYVRGAYSYHSMKSSPADSEQLRASYSPDGVERILFAGEATHERYYSTINAALETGIQAAEKVRELLG